MKRTSSRPMLALLLFGAGLAVSSPTALGQSCSANTVPQGRVCSKEGARCSPPTLGGGNVGTCATETAPANALVCECQGAPTPSYNITVSPLAPSPLSSGVATSTITVIPFNGFAGKIDFTCAVSGIAQPAPSCATPAPATVTGPGSATSLVTVSADSSTGADAFTVTVKAVDAQGRAPDNGAQSSTLLVSHSALLVGSNGSNLNLPKIVLIAFLVLVALCVLVYLVRTRRRTSS